MTLTRACRAFPAALVLLLAACGTGASPSNSPASPSSGAPSAAASSAASPAAGSASSSASAAAPASKAASSQRFSIGNVALDPLPQRAPIHLSINLTAYYVIPIYMAIAKGYFDKAGLDVNMELAKQTNLTVPRLSKGELDIADTSAKPPLFNQVAEGFNARIISSTTIFRSGRVANTWLSVDPAKANQFHELGDLKGTTVEAGLEGSALDQFVSQGLEQAGLKLGKDVNITFRAKGPSDMLALARSHAADVIVMPEPVATQAESEGLLKRWKSDADLIPWYQALYLVASDHFRTSNRPALVKFLEVYLASAREVNASNGTWQDDVLQTTAKQTTIDADVLKKMGGVPLSEPNGAVSMDSLTRTQDLWVGRGLVKQPVKDFGQLVDTSPLDEALQAIGRAPAP